jgi:MoaA/NifB/PqqE/SkfB family radical SAM enzyme
MCDSWRLPPTGELTPAEAGRAFRSIGPLEVVRLTGGEPFLREDLGELARRVWDASRPAVVHVTTNGSFPERVAAFVDSFPRPGVLRFMVSFDGLAEEHNRNRGAAVTFATALETVQILASRRGPAGLRVSANHSVISPRSLADAEGLRGELARFGVELHTVLAYADSAIYGLSSRGGRAEHAIVPVGYPLHPALAGADTLGFVARERRRASAMNDAALRIGKRYYLRGLESRLRGAGSPTPRPRCVALRSHVRVLPDGMVVVCQFNARSVGDLRLESADAIWRGPVAREERRWVDACPGCWAECEAIPNAIFTGDIVRGIVG